MVLVRKEGMQGQGRPSRDAAVAVTSLEYVDVLCGSGDKSNEKIRACSHHYYHPFQVQVQIDKEAVGDYEQSLE